jgi:hypothetical protein
MDAQHLHVGLRVEATQYFIRELQLLEEDFVLLVDKLRIIE